MIAVKLKTDEHFRQLVKAVTRFLEKKRSESQLEAKK